MEIEIDAAAPLEELRALLREYPDSISVPLETADFEQWLEALPGPYAPPPGALLVARANGGSAGCVALRSLDDETGEIKRLYVRDAFRGAGLGRARSSRS
jgi:putative acetyltransferase